MDALHDYFWDFAQDHLPYNVYDALYSFSGHLSTVFNGLNAAITWAYRSANGTQEVERLSITEQIIPPLLSIIAIYFGLISLYRTTASFIRTTVSIVKWVSIITLLALGAGYFAARGPVDTGTLLRLAAMVASGQQRDPLQNDARERVAPRTGRTRGQRVEPGGRRPSILEPFLAHEEWKNGQVQLEDTQQYIKQVVDGAQKVYKDGASFLDVLFKRNPDGEASEDDYVDDDDDGTPRRRTRAQTRRARRNRG